MKENVNESSFDLNKLSVTDIDKLREMLGIKLA